MEKIVERESIDCANLINCIGEIHCKMGNYSESLRWCEESLHIK
jgi:predicted DNA-binding ribbon-helix-helix protein